jgi:putative transposase
MLVAGVVMAVPGLDRRLGLLERAECLMVQRGPATQASGTARCALRRSPAWPHREIVNAILFDLRGGIPWRMLPPCFPPHQTEYGCFARWRNRGEWGSIDHHFVMIDRERVGRDASPTAAVIDNQSVKTTEAGGARRRGRQESGRPRAQCDGGYRWSLAVSACVLVVSTDSQRDVSYLQASHRRFPFVQGAFADTAYAAERVANATRIAIEIVQDRPGQVGFLVHPRRWVVEHCKLRGHRRLRNRLSLCRLRHATNPTPRSFHINSESDSHTNGLKA